MPDKMHGMSGDHKRDQRAGLPVHPKVAAQETKDAADDRADRKAGIREGSARDRKMDAAKGVPEND